MVNTSGSGGASRRLTYTQANRAKSLIATSSHFTRHKGEGPSQRVSTFLYTESGTELEITSHVY